MRLPIYLVILIVFLVLNSADKQKKKNREREKTKPQATGKPYRDLTVIENEQIQLQKDTVEQYSELISNEQETAAINDTSVSLESNGDDGEVYTDEEWEILSHQAVENRKMISQKRTALQEAFIYSEIFGKPKGLD